MNRKNIIGRIVCLVSVVAFVLTGTASGQGLSLKVRLYGGMNYLSGGDLNDGLEGMMKYEGDWAQTLGYTFSGQFNGAHGGPTFGGDFILQITPLFGIGLGTGYLGASRESKFTLTTPVMNATETITPDLHAVPLKLSFFLSFPSGAITVSLHAGLGYYIATASGNWRRDEIDGWTNNHYEVESKGGIGFHGGLGLEFNISSHFAVFLEAQGQYASLSGFEATYLFTSSFGATATTSGKLYYIEGDLLDGQYYPWLILETTPPSGPGYRTVREAKVDFSGGEIVAGIVVKF